MNNINGLIKANQISNKLTKESIQEALLVLLSKKAIEEVRITEIVKKAGISRTAFYNNYTSKEEVLNDIITTFLKSINKRIHIYENPTSYHWFLTFFTEVKKNARFFSFISTVIPRYLLNLTPNGENDSNNVYEQKAFEAAIGVLIYTWLNDPKESPSEMAIICEKMFKGFSNITYITKNV